MIERLVKDLPQAKDMFEYEDYLASRTRKNASEFISRAIEDNAGFMAKRGNYVKYISQRPRAERLGSHALFTAGKGTPELPQATEKIAAHPAAAYGSPSSLCAARTRAGSAMTTRSSGRLSSLPTLWIWPRL